MNSIKEITKNESFEVEIEKWSSDGSGVCRINGRAVFVPNTIPGERWQIKILKVTSTMIYAKGEVMLRASECRTTPNCSYYRKCGGCKLQHINYQAELNFKLAKVNDALKHIGKQTLFADNIIGACTPEHYRNKGIYAIQQQNGHAVYGFYRAHSHEVIPITECLIQNDLADKVAISVTNWMNKNCIEAYDEKTNKGTVRHIFTRTALHTNDAVACIISAKGFGDKTNDLVNSLKRDCPSLTGIVLNINKSIGNTVLSGDFYTLHGNETLHDLLCGFEFELSPQSFYQVNPKQAEKLYKIVVELANLTKLDTVLDLYCGAGTISLCLSEKAGKVIGAEVVPEAIVNAKKNAKINNINNVEFICADAGELTIELYNRGVQPTAVVVDPPRKGMYEEAINNVCAINPRRVVYVSCNPATLARDVERFNNKGYELINISTVDMFPRTDHVETVVLLSKGEIDSKKVWVEFSLDDMDMSGFQKGATYAEIKERVLEKTGLKVSSLYIAQVKQKCGIIERENFNKAKSQNARQPQCPPEKENAIKEALLHFGMI